MDKYSLEAALEQGFDIHCIEIDTLTGQSTIHRVKDTFDDTFETPTGEQGSHESFIDGSGESHANCEIEDENWWFTQAD